MTWGWTGVRGARATTDAAESIRLMAEHGVTWTAPAYSALQPTVQSTAPAELYAPVEAVTNDDCCPYGKPAGAILRDAYRLRADGDT